jgi:hypothetical protein
MAATLGNTGYLPAVVKAPPTADFQLERNPASNVCLPALFYVDHILRRRSPGRRHTRASLNAVPLPINEQALFSTFS